MPPSSSLDLPELPTNASARQDAGDDLSFYAPLRLATHIDEVAAAALTARYRSAPLEHGRVLDPMSSGFTHLPLDHSLRDVVADVLVSGRTSDPLIAVTGHV